MTLGEWDEFIGHIDEPGALFLPYGEFRQLARESSFSGSLFSRGWDEQGIFVRSARGTVVRPNSGGVVNMGSEELEQVIRRISPGGGDDIPF